jgi:acetyl esterase/lipase
LLCAASLMVCVKSSSAQTAAPTTQPAQLNLLPPEPLVPGAKVVTLWPAGSPMLKALRGSDQKENLTMTQGQPGRVQRVTNIHNPSLELHLAPPEKANGMAVILAAGGGNTELNVGTEGLDVATWLNGLGISAFIERYRLRPYTSSGDALADTQRCFRLIRANAKEWGVDPKKVGIMGFSAGGEQAAWVALNFDDGHPESADPVEKFSDRPDFVVLVYAGWARMDLSKVPKNTPPAFLTSAGIDDAFHARQTVEFYDALFKAKIPVELHIYGHGGHANGIKPRNGIPFGTWHLRFVEWATDLGMMKRSTDAAKSASAN